MGAQPSVEENKKSPSAPPLEVVREERFAVDYCYCCGHYIPCGHCGTCMLSLSLAVIVCIITTALVFTNVLGICTSDTQCSAGPGQRARCRGICVVDYLPSVCTSDTDCLGGQCYDSYCADDGTCKDVPRLGSRCDDHSACTFDDRCDNAGVCRGTEIEVPCKRCVNGNLLPDHAQNSERCDDSSKCTYDDRCDNGECRGMPILCPNETCKTSVCHPDVGCQLVNAPDTHFQPDLCTTAKCTAGEYSETFKDCFDGNPCTVDACFPLSGQCVHPLSGEESCKTTCTHSDNCTAIASDASYACWDGNCVDVTSSEMIIRLSHADIDLSSCPMQNGARLQMRFFMDEKIVKGVMHLPMTESIQPLYPHLDVFDVETVNMYDGSAVRTHFSMRTACYDLAKDCFPFINGMYEFVVKRYPCSSIHATHCQMDKPSSTYVTVPLSIVSCPLMQVRIVSFVPELRLTKEYYTITASLELGDVDAWITDVALCIPDERHYSSIAKCILNEAVTDCPYRGCFDTPEQYLDYRITFLRDSNYTGAITAASNAFDLQFARGYANYNGDRCENVSVVDSVRFTTLPVSVNFNGRQAILDVKYDVPLCGSQRRLTETEKSRRLGVFLI